MAGDFNLALNQEMDTYNYTSLNNPRARNVVLEMIIQNSLIDVWREMSVERDIHGLEEILLKRPV